MNTTYEHIFHNTAISVWEEDWTEVHAILDSLRPTIDPKKFSQYLDEHPGIVKDLANAIKILRVNQKTIEIYEADNEDQFKTSIVKTFCDQSFTTFKMALSALYTGVKEFEMEALTKTFKGKDLYTVLYITFPISIEDYKNVVLVMIDITSSKTIRKEYLESQSKFHQSFYQGIVGMSVIDLNGHILDVNDYFCEILGYTKDELLCMNCIHIEFVENAISKNMVSLIRQEATTIKIVYQLKKKNGDAIHVLVGLIMVRDEDNHPLYFVMQVVDVDIQFTTAKIMSENIQKYKQLLKSTGTAYLILDENGNIKEIGDTFLHIFMCKPEDIIDKNLRSMVSSASISVYDDTWDRILQGSTVNTVEICIENNDIFKWVSFNASMIKNGGIKIFVLMSDITEGKKREYQKLIAKEKKRDKLRNKINELRKEIGPIKE